jgi:hypothetical protein
VAITWGAFEYAGGNGMRVGFEVTWATPNSTSSAVNATVEIWTENQFNYSGDTQTLSYSSNLGSATNYTNNQPTGNVSLRATKTYTYTYPSGSYGTSPGNVTFTATLSGTYNGVTPSASITTAIPARPGGIAKVWNGSAWVNGTAKVWNGSAWVVGQVRVWDGNSWEYGI